MCQVKRYNSFLDEHKPRNFAKDNLIPVIEVTEESCLFAKYNNYYVMFYENLFHFLFINSTKSIEELLSYRNLKDVKEIILKYRSTRRSSKNNFPADETIIQDSIPEV